MLISIVAVLFAIAGAIIYALASNPKLSELGKLTFAAAMFALMFAYAAHTVRIG